MFDYLKDDDETVKPTLRHIFGVVSEDEIKLAEKCLGYIFPSELRQFFLEVGEGSLRHNKDFSAIQEYYANRILHPKESADIKLLGYDSGLIVPSVKFAEDELPIFEVDGGEMFFVMKPQSDKPNAVYRDMGQGVLEDSFEKFIWRLYYENPLYYMKDWGKAAED
jgi:hypothetical protein